MHPMQPCESGSKRNRAKSIREIELPRHVKARGTDNQTGRPRLPHETALDCTERLQSIFTEIAAANCRQRYRRRRSRSPRPAHVVREPERRHP